MKILIVDDSKYQRYLIEITLSKFGQCDQAADGEEAVERYTAALDAGAPYDLVVMDILMPRLDGHEALKRIMALQKNRGIDEAALCKAIMLSSLDDPVNMMQAQFEDGANIYVTKPFDETVLVEALRGLGLVENLLEDETL